MKLPYAVRRRPLDHSDGPSGSLVGQKRHGQSLVAAQEAGPSDRI